MEKRIRTSNSKNEQSMDDRIGQLPDDVLGLIVSHLTLKEAGRTSVLSRRWINLWTLTPHFKFDASERMRQIMRYSGSMERERYEDVVESERRKYIRWVDQVVENHQGSDLDELVVVFRLDNRHSLRLDKWISFAVRKRVKAIKIDLGLLSYASIGKYSFMRSVPGLSGIEFLTSLCLKNVDITGETIEHLLFACPLLERLCLALSNQLLNLRVVGSSLKLKYLVIYRCCSLESIEICAPNLMSLHYHIPMGKRPKLQVGGLCCLVDLYINSCRLNYELFQFSSYFAQLKTLTLNSEYIEILLVQRGLPKLTNLKHLTFQIQGFRQLRMSQLAEFISLCPFLHKFTLELLISANSEEKIIEWGGPLRRHQYLKVVEMLGFVGRSHEIGIARFFLITVIKLEKLIINTHCRSLATDQNKVGVLFNAVAPGSREKAEQLRSEMRPGVELLICNVESNSACSCESIRFA